MVIKPLQEYSVWNRNTPTGLCKGNESVWVKYSTHDIITRGNFKIQFFDPLEIYLVILIIDVAKTIKDWDLYGFCHAVKFVIITCLKLYHLFYSNPKITLWIIEQRQTDRSVQFGAKCTKNCVKIGMIC